MLRGLHLVSNFNSISLRHGNSTDFHAFRSFGYVPLWINGKFWLVKLLVRILRKHRPPGGQPSAELPGLASRSMLPSYTPHAMLSRSILRLSFVILSQHLSRHQGLGIQCRAPHLADTRGKLFKAGDAALLLP